MRGEAGPDNFHRPHRMMANTKGRPSSWYAAQDAAADDQPSYEQLLDRLQRVEEENEQMRELLKRLHAALNASGYTPAYHVRMLDNEINTLLADLESSNEDDG